MRLDLIIRLELFSFVVENSFFFHFLEQPFLGRDPYREFFSVIRKKLLDDSSQQ